MIGAGPAGLAAALEMSRGGRKVVVVEKEAQVGGLSKTCRYKDCLFDIGGHRFFTRIDEVMRLWFELLEKDFRITSRLSRIYYRGRLFNYPIKPLNALAKLGPLESILVLASFLRVKLAPYPELNTFEEWVSQQFGRRLFRIFFKNYTEKVWGISCDQISADWAAQRIKGLTLKSLLKSAFNPFKNSRITTLIEEFHYPESGPGMLYERMAARVAEQGGEILTGTEATAFRHDGKRIAAAVVRDGNGQRELAGDHFLASNPITRLVAGLEPSAPGEVGEAAAGLKFRSHIAVNLLIDQKEVFPDNWIYVHSPELRMGRIQNYKNWSPKMVYNPDITTLGVEYFCDPGDEFWNRSDEELLELGKGELAQTGLVDSPLVFDGFVARSEYAYPVYRIGYERHLGRVKKYLEGFANLHCIGRSGQYQYNNMDHSILTGLLAARNILDPGRRRDIWHTKIEDKYIEY